jgi:hypothetical protein
MERKILKISARWGLTYLVNLFVNLITGLFGSN